MSTVRSLFVAACTSLVAGTTFALPQAGVDWNAATAEHLLNRAAFGATSAEIEAAVAAGLEATVDDLIRRASGPGEGLESRAGRLRGEFIPPPEMMAGPDFDEEPPTLAMIPDFFPDKGVYHKVADVRGYGSAWIDSMLAGDDPLRDRMTIFWHGHFVSSYREVQDSRDMLVQMAFLRANALGNLETLVRGIARDPAMLEYLNNDINVKASPNENWARELMELFTLGVGNYTEADIKEAARAFSGWTVRDHEFYFARDQHDYGPKTVLGVTGNLDGDLVIDILLAREACAEFLAGKLLTYFEGAMPSAERQTRYATSLRDSGYDFAAMLRELFLDPEFYRAEILGNRVAAPIEYFVGMARRMGVEAPADILYVASALSGQRLLAPPNVKGWEEGFSWLNTGSVMQRSNYGGILLGEFDRELDARGIAQQMIAERRRGFQGPYREYLGMVAWLGRVDWQCDLPPGAGLVSGADLGDAEAIALLVETLLPVPVEEATITQLVELTKNLRYSTGIAEGGLLARGSEELLEQLVHIILSLPEAQML